MRAVERTMTILEILAGATKGVRLTDICGKSGLDGSTALRYLNTLIKLGYARCEPSDRPVYHASTQLTRLGGSSQLSILRRVTRPYLEALCAACGEDVNLGTMDAGSAICLETEKASHILGVHFASGLRVPAYASSLGKAMLAFIPADRRRALLANMAFERFTPTTIPSLSELEAELEVVRRQNFATDREEYTVGVVCIGAPVFDADGHVVGALSITAPAQRLPLERLQSLYAKPLLATCRAISAELGFEPQSTEAIGGGG